jgi:hypothetical protein
MGGRWEAYDRPDRAFAAWATNDDLTLVIAGWPYREFEANKKDLEGNYLQTLELAPLFAERLRRATRETRLVGAVVPNFFRKPYGPGWVLVGDAGYNKDFVTAQGIQDASDRPVGSAADCPAPPPFPGAPPEPDVSSSSVQLSSGPNRRLGPQGAAEQGERNHVPVAAHVCWRDIRHVGVVRPLHPVRTGISRKSPKA